MGGVWCFLIGLVLGVLIGIYLTALFCAAPDDPEDRDGGEWPDGS